MAVPFSNTKLRAPRGFRNVLEGLSREILRSQPSDIYAFGSLYFEKLLQIRAESGVDPVDFGAHEEDRFYNDTSYSKDAVKHERTMDKEKAAVKIQTKYRQHTAKKVVRGMREERAAVKIQAVYRGHLDRKHIQHIKHAADACDTEAHKLAREEDEEEEEREGDTPSKTMLKDFPDRKEIDKLKAVVMEREAALAKEVAEEQKKEAEEDEEEEPEEEMSDLEDAATRIQAGMRGLLTRLSLKQGQLSAGAQEESAAVEQQKTDGKMGESEEEEEEQEDEMNDLGAGMGGVKGQPGDQTGEDEEAGQREESGTKEGEQESETKEGEKEESGTKEGERGDSETKDANEENGAENKE